MDHEPRHFTGKDTAKIGLPLLALLASVEALDRPFNAEFSLSVDRLRATDELKHEGVTRERRTAYVPGVSEVIYRAITPFGYQTQEDVLNALPHNLVDGRETAEVYGNDEVYSYPKEKIPHRDDAWRFYLGMPQQHDTFSISDYLPPGQKNGYSYAINGWLDDFLLAHGEWDVQLRKDQEPVITSIRPATIKEVVRWCREGDEVQRAAKLKRLQQLRDHVSTSEQADRLTALGHIEGKMRLLTQLPQPPVPELVECLTRGNMQTIDGRPDSDDSVMGHYQVYLGEDKDGSYLAYYDRWDLDGSPVEGEKGLFGRPFVIYDRVYYDPATYEIIQPRD